MISWLPHRREATVRFRSTRERSLWLLLAAVAAGALWAIAQQLDWPVAVRAALAALAAASVVAIPELRQRGARSDKSAQLVGRLVATTRDGMPLARDATLDDLRVHESSSVVAYVHRDAEGEVDALLRAGTPTLLVGHSMAGKTRLAVERVRAVLPDAPLLIPPSTSVLRSLLDDGLIVKGVVVWLDDIDRFLKGDNSLDVPLVKQLMAGGAVLVGTIRVHEFQEFIPTELDRPAPWEVIRHFKRIRLDRRLTSKERDRAGEVITEPAVLEAINRYGLAEYLGGGPQAVERYENGETESPVGHALVHAAIDWRRAGLARNVPRASLVASLPEYLADRPAVTVDEPSIERGFEWAVKRINETVALLTHIERRNDQIDAQEHLYEAFDYLVDQLAATNTPIPAGVWLQVVRAASLAESRDVNRAIDRFFYARPGVTAEIARWLNSDTEGKVLVVTGSAGVGKSSVLAQITLMARAVRTSDGIRPALPHLDHVTRASHKKETELARELAVALDLPLPPDYPNVDRYRARHELVLAIRERARPVFVSIDGLDESTEPELIVDLLGTLARIRSPSVHILTATRRNINLPDWPTINLDDHRIDDDILHGFVMDRLLVGEYGNEFAADPKAAENAASAIVERSEGNILFAAIAAESWSTDPRENLERLPLSIRDVLAKRIEALAADYPLTVPLLKSLARGEQNLSEDEIVRIMRNEQLADPEPVLDTLRALGGMSLIARTWEKDTSEGRYYITHALIREYVREQY
jgi:hypothetical protein